MQQNLKEVNMREVKQQVQIETYRYTHSGKLLNNVKVLLFFWLSFLTITCFDCLSIYFEKHFPF